MEIKRFEQFEFPVPHSFDEAQASIDSIATDLMGVAVLTEHANHTDDFRDYVLDREIARSELEDAKAALAIAMSAVKYIERTGDASSDAA